jgi:hypothetical protein
VLHDVLRAPDHDGRDTVLLQVTRDQTHGLVADRSDRSQDCDVNLFLAA